MSEDLLGVLSVLFGVLLLPGVSVPLTRAAAEGRLARNGAAGIRTRATRASDAAWRAGHAAALPKVWHTVGVAAVTVVLTAAVWLLGSGGWAVLVGMLGLLAETAVLLAAAGSANRAARAAHAAESGSASGA